MESGRQIPIWFFIGLVLAFYGLVILSSGLYHLFRPAARVVALQHLHPDLWWSALLLIIVLIYVIKYAPRRR